MVGLEKRGFFGFGGVYGIYLEPSRKLHSRDAPSETATISSNEISPRRLGEITMLLSKLSGNPEPETLNHWGSF